MTLLRNEEITTVFQENYQNLCRFAESIVGRGRNAQDIAQESFVRLCETELSNIAASEIRFWLFRVARNLALDEVKKINTRAGLWIRVTKFFDKPTVNPEDSLVRSENQRIVMELLNLLPEHQRSALLLREREEMSYREIASVLNASEGKIKVDIFRARERLRRLWFERHK